MGKNIICLFFQEVVLLESNTDAKRSNIMKKIKSVSKVEDKVSKALWNKGFRFRRNVKDLFGKPDIAIKKYKVVIFIDSCFWHACPTHGHMPKSNLEYWEKKLNRNKQRDVKVNQYYLEHGWKVKRVWEHDLKKSNIEQTIEEIADFIKECKPDTVRNRRSD